MNEVLKAIAQRRSVRAYRSDELPRDSLELILEAGRIAPTGMNMRGWHFLVFEGNALARLRVIAGEELGYGAPVLVVVSYCGDARSLNPGSDCANAIMCMMLAAHSLGVGSCWINNLTRRRDEPAIAAALRAAGLPEGQTVHGSLALGFADEIPTPKYPADGVVSYAL